MVRAPTIRITATRYSLHGRLEALTSTRAAQARETQQQPALLGLLAQQLTRKMRKQFGDAAADVGSLPCTMCAAHITQLAA